LRRDSSPFPLQPAISRKLQTSNRYRFDDNVAASKEATRMAQNTAQTTSALREVLDPRGQPTAVIQPTPLAPRLDTIEGKTVYLVDVGFGGGYEFLEEAAAWLQEKIPSVKTELRHKKGNMFMSDPDLYQEIKLKGDAVIVGVGG
jgi:hypothetical protein